jgi:hypothetical protein
MVSRQKLVSRVATHNQVVSFMSIAVLASLAYMALGEIASRELQAYGKLRVSTVIQYGEARGVDFGWKTLETTANGTVVSEIASFSDDEWNGYENTARWSGNLTAAHFEDYNTTHKPGSVDIFARDFNTFRCYGSGSWARAWVLGPAVYLGCKGFAYAVAGGSNQVIRVRASTDGIEFRNEAGAPMHVIMVFRARLSYYYSNQGSDMICGIVIGKLIDSGCPGKNQYGKKPSDLSLNDS